MDCSLPGSSICGIFQARVLEWVAISFFRGSSQPRDQTQVSCIAGRCFNLWATREVRFRKAPLWVKVWRHALNLWSCFLVWGWGQASSVFFMFYFLSWKNGLSCYNLYVFPSVIFHKTGAKGVCMRGVLLPCWALCWVLLGVSTVWVQF